MNLSQKECDISTTAIFELESFARGRGWRGWTNDYPLWQISSLISASSILK